MGWTVINNDIFKQTTYLVELCELNFEQYLKDNQIEELTKLYFDIELHLNTILDFLKKHQITERDFTKLEYNFKKLNDHKIKYHKNINTEIYKSLQETHFFYDDVLNDRNVLIEVNNKNESLHFKKLIDCLNPIKKRQSIENERFNVDLLFATGEAQILYEKYKLRRDWLKTICLETNIDLKYKSYFTYNFTDKKVSPRNVLNFLDLMLLIEKHCIKNNIIICDEFKNELDAMKLKK